MSALYKSESGQRLVHERYRSILDQWPDPNERLRIPTREGETFVLRCGPPEAPPVVLLHGAMATSAMWTGDVTEWSRHFRLHAVDLIGEPGLSAPSRPRYDSESYALWLDDVLDGLGLERAALVGISLGGWIATDYATRRPGRVTAAVLLCPGGIGRPRMSPIRALLTLIPLLLLGNWGRRRAFRKVLGPLETTTPAAAALYAFTLLIAEHFRPRTAPLAQFSDETLRKLTIPVLAIVGGRDALLDSDDTRRRLAAAVPHADIRYLPEVGHAVVNQTAPIRDFLSRAAGRAPVQPAGRRVMRAK